MIPAVSTSHSVQSGTEVLAFHGRQSPYLFAFPWNAGTAGTRYADPAVLTQTTVDSEIAWSAINSSDGTASIAVAHSVNPFLTVYPWSKSGGIGAKLTNPATLPSGAGLGIDISGNGDGFTRSFIYLGTSTTPFLHVYRWTASAIGVKAADAATVVAGSVYDIHYSDLNSRVVMTHANTPFVSVYVTTYNITTGNPAIGSKDANPATLPSTTTGGGGARWANSSSHFFVATTTTPFIHAYPWSSATGIGTKIANPSNLPNGSCWQVRLTQNDSHVAVVHDTSPHVSVYPWTGAFGTKLVNAVTPVGNSGYGVRFTENKLIIVGSSATPVSIYDWDGISIGTKQSAPVGSPTDNTYSVAYKPISKF